MVVFAGDHGVAAAGRVGVSRRGDRRRWWRTSRPAARRSTCSPNSAGAGVRVVDIAVDTDDRCRRRSARTRSAARSGNIAVEDALTRRRGARRRSRPGRRIADEEVDAGADLLIAGDMGIGNTTPATDADRRADRHRAGRRGRPGHRRRRRRLDPQDRRDPRRAVPGAQARPRIPLALLRVCGGADLAAMAGFCAQAAVRRTPVLLDGVVVTAAALVAERTRARRPAVVAGRAPLHRTGAHAGAAATWGSTRSSTSACGWAKVPAPWSRCPCCGPPSPPWRRWRRSKRPVVHRDDGSDTVIRALAGGSSRSRRCCRCRDLAATVRPRRADRVAAWSAPRSGGAGGRGSSGRRRAGVRRRQPRWPALLAVAALLSATRGLHVDGLADTADGLGCYGPPERALAVMRDGSARAVRRRRGGADDRACRAWRSPLTSWLAVRRRGRRGPGGGGAGLPPSVPAAAGQHVGRRGRGHPAAVGRRGAGSLAVAAAAASGDAAALAGPGGRAGRAGGSRGALVAHCVRRFGGITGDVLGAARRGDDDRRRARAGRSASRAGSSSRGCRRRCRAGCRSACRAAPS